MALGIKSFIFECVVHEREYVWIWGEDRFSQSGSRNLQVSEQQMERNMYAIIYSVITSKHMDQFANFHKSRGDDDLKADNSYGNGVV